MVHESFGDAADLAIARTILRLRSPVWSL